LAAACFEKGGDVEQAKKLYKQVVDEAKEGDDFAKRKSEERLIWLEVAQNSKG
jgi:hypothetical protein